MEETLNVKTHMQEKQELPIQSEHYEILKHLSVSKYRPYTLDDHYFLP